MGTRESENLLLPDSQYSSLEACSQRRREAERHRNDRQLLRCRMLERSFEGLPVVVDTVYREELLWADAISTVWRGRSNLDGKNYLLRCIRPEWKEDVVILRRLRTSREVFGASLPPQISLPLWRGQGDWPHLRFCLGQGQLAYAEMEYWDELDWSIALAGIMDGLIPLHQRKLSLGLPPWLISSVHKGRARLLWMDPFDVAFQPEEDFRSLARWAQSYGPFESSSLPSLVCDWLRSPPPSAEDALWLARRVLPEYLSHFVRRLRHRHEVFSHKSRHIRLMDLSKRLQTRPPAAHLHSESFSLNSNGNKVEIRLGGSEWQQVFAQEEGLNPRLSMKLCRQWPNLSTSLTAEDKRAGDLLIRWLQIASKLRRLLAFQRVQSRNLF